MNEGPRYVSFRDYVRVARERRILIIVLTLLFTASAFYYGGHHKRGYEAEASVDFQSLNEQASVFGLFQDTGGETPDQRAAVNAETLVSPAVLKRAAKKLKGKATEELLFQRVEARAEARTNLVIVTAKGTTAQQAADFANAMADAAVAVSRERARSFYKKAADAKKKVVKGLKGRANILPRLQLQSDIARLDELARVASPAAVQREASPPTAPVGPGTALITVLGLLIGLTVGLVAAFVRDSLDRRFKSSHELADAIHLPVLGMVSEDALGQSPIGVKRRKPLSEADLEAFRIVRTKLEFLDPNNTPRLVLVTSALPEEGKSTVSLALASVYAAAGLRTLLVECDLRRPTFAKKLGIAQTPGLTDYLSGRANPSEILQVVALPNPATNGAAGTPHEGASLVAIAAGSPSPQPAELLRSERAVGFFDQIREVYDIVIIDSPPLLSVVDALDVLPLSDAVIMCLRTSRTTRDQARAARGALSQLPDRPTGIVITGVRDREEALQYGYYSYGEVYGSPPARR